MEQSLRILHLEDDPVDAELVAATLAAAGVQSVIVRVKTRAEFLDALNQDFDLVLSDHSLPGFDGVAAQVLAGERRPDLPFVFVSGTMGEEVAIERLNAGATDYVLKQRLERLPTAVRRALDEARNRRERERAEAEVRRLNAELEARVVERTQQLASANEALARHEAELSKTTAFLDSIVENLPAMVFVKDAVDRRFVLFNRAGEELLGMSRAEILGRTARDVFPPPIADAFEQRDSELLAGRTDRSTVDEVVATRARGPRILHTKKMPVVGSDGGPAYLLGISVDVTERRHAEEEARLAKLEAERANKSKSDFLSRMSHDLRTPLNAILGFAQLLESDESLGPDQADNARQILRGGAHLLELINEVLEISRIEAGQLALSLEPVGLFETVREVVDLMRPLAESRGIAMTCDTAHDGWYVRGDKQRLRQVLVNLIGNAVKYNRPNGTVHIAAERTDGRVRLRISDTGLGIPEEKRSLLFRPFERLGAEQGPVEGTGLGLALAKALIEAMSGSIGAENQRNGATFWIELPETQPAGESHGERVVAGPAAARHGQGTVLYIEDNRSNVRLLQRLLERRPTVRLLFAGTGAEGIAVATREQPGLIFLDLHLPDMHGEAILRRLRATPRTASIPVAVLSADATGAQSERLLAGGAQAYVTKPFALTTVLALIDEHLASASPSTTNHD
jgi:PAS domain S-box-containing protein